MTAVWPFLLWLAAWGAAGDDAPPPEPVDAPVLVQFDRDAVAALGGDGSLDGMCERLAAVLEWPPDTDVRETGLSLLSRAPDAPVDFSRRFLIVPRLTPGDREAIAAWADRLLCSPLIAYAEPDYDAFGWKTPAPEGPTEESAAGRDAPELLLPDDPWFPLQYYHRLIQTPAAWRVTTGSPGVTVAVVDSGCNPGIADLAGRVLDGCNLIEGNRTMADTQGHGTAIAALIGATGNNGKGIAGIDWQCRLLPINATPGGLSVWIDAIEYAVAAGARVINISGRIHLPEASPLLERALAEAAAAGAVVVASAGNQGESHLAWPAASPYVISVGATDIDERPWRDPGNNLGSNFGPGLDLVAPGRDIVSINAEDKKTEGQGTSCSAALVSGACALMYAVNPALRPEQVRRILHETADKIGPAKAYTKGYSARYGYGRLNVYKAVCAARELAKP